MKHTYLLFFVAITIWVGCSNPEEELSFDPNLEILFSNDSVSFDTLLSDTRSSTRRLSIFNPNEAAIQLTEISLGLLETSDYSVTINGRAEDAVFNERILGGDSLLILVEVNIDPRNQDTPYLVKDSIVFSWNGNSEHVKLVSWGQDTRKVSNQLICDETWTSNRPYVLEDTVLVSPGCVLTIERGTHIFFSNEAALFIQGSLIVDGDSANHVIFRNARFDGVFNEVPGQWNGIYFLEGSTGSRVSYAEIFNGQIGLRLGTPDNDDEPDVVVNNTVIHTMSEAGILAFTSDIDVTNTLIYNCGTFLAGHFLGGNYTYRHTTFSNDQSLFVSQDPSVQFSDNIIVDNDQVLTEDLFFEITNSIIWGRNEEELLISNGGGSNLTAVITANIIRSAEDLPSNFTSLEFNFPGFNNAFPFDYSLDSLAFARDKGADIGIPFDIIDAPRDNMPDIGAYERVDSP